MVLSKPVSEKQKQKKEPGVFKMSQFVFPPLDLLSQNLQGWSPGISIFNTPPAPNLISQDSHLALHK